MSIPIVTDSEMVDFACSHGVLVAFYGDKFGKNVRVSFLENGVEFGHVNTIRMKRPADGEPHTIESAVSDALWRLMQDRKQRMSD